MTETIKTHQRINKLAQYAEWAALVGMSIFILCYTYFLYILVFDRTMIDTAISFEFLGKNNKLGLDWTQRLITLPLFMASDILGLYGLCIARDLFAGYRQNKIFTTLAASRLKTIGWVVVLLAPVSQLSQSLGASYLSMVIDPTKFAFNLSLGDGDIYAVVFGLLIVVVGHIMYEAIDLSNENKSFV